MSLDDLIGAELLECHFGRVWVRLVFSGTQQKVFWLDTDNLISDHCVQRFGADGQRIAASVSTSVFPFLERRLERIERVPNGMRLVFDFGGSLFICYHGETIDSLLKLTDLSSGEWLVA